MKMDVLSFFEPYPLEKIKDLQKGDPTLIVNAHTHFAHYQKNWMDNTYQLAIIGVPEARNTVGNEGAIFAPDEIRKQFYKLYSWGTALSIVDLGNLKIGETCEDTYEILSEVLVFFIERDVVPIILGGGNDLVFANYMAYQKMEQVVNMVSVDSLFDLNPNAPKMNSQSYLTSILLQEPSYLFNYAQVGYQTYLNSPREVKEMESLFFETYRLGLIRQDMEEVEPIVRNADLLSIDISCVRKGDAPGHPHSSPHGFYGEELCQIAMYAGVSDKLSSIGIYEFSPSLDYQDQTSQLISHVIWYFIEGFRRRIGDTHFKEKDQYLKYSVPVSGHVEDLVFFKSKRSGRWWVIVPVTSKQSQVVQKYYLPCSKRDYDMACKDVISDRWWNAFKKFNH